MEFQCSICSYTSPSMFNVEQHINKKNKCGDNPIIIPVPIEIKCEYCNKLYKTRKNLREHLKICSKKEVGLQKQIDLLKEVNEDLKKQIQEMKTIKKEDTMKKLEETNKKLTTENKKLKEMVITKAQIRAESRKLYKKNYKLKCVHCKNNNEKNIQICHIKPVSEFTLDNLSEVNNMSNLIALCANCHIDLDVSKKDDVVRTAKLHKFIVNHVTGIKN